VTALHARPDVATFHGYDKYFITRLDPYIEHPGLPDGDLNIDLALLDELADAELIAFGQVTARYAWDQRSSGHGRFELRPRDTGARELPFEITLTGLAIGPPRSGRIRDLVDWQPSSWQWPGSFKGLDYIRPDVATAYVKSAEVVHDGVCLYVEDGAQTFRTTIKVQNVRERQLITEALNRAPGLVLEAAGDLRVP
jgi:hypothetical protein